jgi:hypothetical protein
MDRPAWAGGKQFRTTAGRLRRQADSTHLTAWTRQYTPREGRSAYSSTVSLLTCPRRCRCLR